MIVSSRKLQKGIQSSARSRLPLLPIRVNRVRDMVVDQLTRLIVERNLRPGDRLPPELELCARLEVGRSTIREALLSLSERGILEIQHGKGSFVASIPTARLRERLSRTGNRDAGLEDAWAVREALETRVAMYAAERRTAKDLRRLEETVRQMDVAIARGGTGRRQDALFHEALADAARSSLLRQLLRDIMPFVAHARHQALSMPGRPKSSNEEHRALLDAIRLSDALLAGVRMYQHLSFGRQLTSRKRARNSMKAR